MGDLKEFSGQETVSGKDRGGQEGVGGQGEVAGQCETVVDFMLSQVVEVKWSSILLYHFMMLYK